MIGSTRIRAGQPIRMPIVVGQQDGRLPYRKRSVEMVELSARVGPPLLETGAPQC